MSRTYYAVSTENFQMCGMSLLGIGSTRAEAESEALENLGALNPTDFRSQTWHKNLRVVSKTEALRKGWVNAYMVENFLLSSAER